MRRVPSSYGEQVSEPPPSALTEPTDALMAMSRFMTAVVARTLADLDDAVNVSQLRILVMLHYESPVNRTTIAEGLGVDRSNASRPCDKLVRARLIRRSDDEVDRRNVALSLTPKGRRLIDSLMDRRREILGELVSEMKPGDREHLSAGLSAFLELVERHHDDELVGMPPGAILHWIR
jgi:DNA-binding MarR family transcriptional regulator